MNAQVFNQMESIQLNIKNLKQINRFALRNEDLNILTI